ncbi:50S ribosomal protein L3 [candidate division Kazan bacterium RIFCSPHIGHO2_01_FULL_49_10]|uniref:50S ribosomal protein L3 n=1 Tax=candidate division Kazan bacterium RIFCSPLOWO2_01_FULL_48_13 TaxID=1798539 RepID=A0A1F4PPV8_UNCK3|nr:MAG: 50S ribosomal protein L3 [candidate division Kazan bacterium RIFCSPHIGHO2_01_FULL_49_10]OGB85659.1 MAG: 50S ribosomal protein L3 [candidate division Kazan bacterium RIFCSPLOWO2_01_FULL_48_13]
MKGLLARKIDMSQLILPDGAVAPVTWLTALPNVVTQVKTAAVDGYAAVQIGAGRAKKLNRAAQGHLKELDVRKLQELKGETELKRGDKIDLSIFEVGDIVSVTGISKGKGFSGTVKRHGFSRGPMGHGHDHHRAPGSIGPMGIARVLPGKRMSGHQGAEQVTTRGLKVMAIDLKTNTIAIKGSVPGARHSWLLIRK